MKGRKRTRRDVDDYNIARMGLRHFERYYGQRTEAPETEYQRQRRLRIENHGTGTPSLPSVSILETPTDLTDADYFHGVRALREAGL
jgi:hypothetical protein